MLDLVLLPDETVLIINGAQFGQAGYDEARQATLNPLIYDPKASAGNRIRVVGESEIARVCKYFY
jgi:hypothetical protein